MEKHTKELEKEKSLLMKIQGTVIQYVDIISKVSRVDVEVVDKNLFRVAGTGMFSGKVNEDMSSEGYVYNQVLKTGRRQVIYEPGEELICHSCPQRNVCQEEIEISMPVRLGTEIIGIIGVVGSTREQKERILEDELLYMDFLEQITAFIAAKAKEYVELENKNAMLSTLDCTIEHIDQGIMILGNDHVVTTANAAAKKQLELEHLEGSLVQISPTGDHLNHLIEYKMKLRDQKFFVMGHMYDLPKPTKRYSVVVVFESSRNLQKKYYEMTSTVHTLDSSSIIGSSPQTLRLKEEILKVAQTSSTVLITGESGTGKEMVATAIWNASERRKGRFVAINCAAIPEALLESELFGYVKGAFTGADPNGRIGKFELANHGVIFLDEIGDMPLYLQAKLLRVLQERKIIRIGSNQVIPIDVRILAATNKNLMEMIKEKRFREDLYYRLNVIPMELSPLRERPEDIEELAVFFAERYARLLKKHFWKITESVMEQLKAYRWDGNVRELENMMEFMVNMMGEDGIMDEETLPDTLRREVPEKNAVHTESTAAYAGDSSVYAESGADGQHTERTEKGVGILPGTPVEDDIVPLKELERKEIEKAIRLCGNTTKGKKEAAKQLGIGLATLYRKLEEQEKSQ